MGRYVRICVQPLMAKIVSVCCGNVDDAIILLCN